MHEATDPSVVVSIQCVVQGDSPADARTTLLGAKRISLRDLHIIKTSPEPGPLHVNPMGLPLHCRWRIRVLQQQANTHALCSVHPAGHLSCRAGAGRPGIHRDWRGGGRFQQLERAQPRPASGCVPERVLRTFTVLARFPFLLSAPTFVPPFRPALSPALPFVALSPFLDVLPFCNIYRPLRVAISTVHCTLQYLPSIARSAVPAAATHSTVDRRAPT